VTKFFLFLPQASMEGSSVEEKKVEEDAPLSGRE